MGSAIEVLGVIIIAVVITVISGLLPRANSVRRQVDE